ncbi:Piso0_001548 [Millerozyma farinosa CBS 7064]|uniref:Mediator of RNA polymerase II transcription subunit 6 n=1 Tax=Pichia sorbitophila (strain ATCC MYA-4447 / BCRC 22081 / CBS 7064 / NBRC 10061 / NRRL Y-12695) TaxID=559304 RepID=G8YNG5_PICSO|nr:Piso0_001548 [Millerozyma farinosa CBS 7064]
MSKDPLDEIQWKSPEWIQQFGLHTANVLDYFSESPFYDRTSNNQVLRMQFQFQNMPPNIHPATYLQSKLTEMTGIEFVIVYSREPDFWIIRKQDRSGPHSTTTLQDYYIIGANVYQAPKIHDIISSRLLATVNSLRNSMDLITSMSKFDVQDGGHLYSNTAEKDASSSAAVSTGVSLNNTPAINTNSVNTNPMNTNTATHATEQASSSSNANTEIPNAVFDSLLSDVITSNKEGTYLDDIPLYGKGSTVESLNLVVNIDDI